jgi:predicted HTH transcriptional regulator
MTNTSLRARFSIDKKNYSMASRVIADAIDKGLVRRYEEAGASKRLAKYVPFWA